MNTTSPVTLRRLGIIKELEAKVLSQEPLVREAMENYWDKKPKFIVFLSACDGEHRAYVASGLGNQMITAWNNVLDRMQKVIKDTKLVPQWFKADVVTSIRPMPLSSFKEYLGTIKHNYFWEGISFDPLFNIAFLEQEVHANVFFHENKKTGKTQFVWKNIAFYLSRYRFIQASLSDEQVPTVYLFATQGFFNDGHECYPLQNGSLNNGRRKSLLSGELIQQVMEQSADYLANQVQENGRFRYGYFPCFDKEIEHYNHLRHASSTYALLEAYEIFGKTEFLTQAEKALDHLIVRGIVTHTEATETTDLQRCFVVEPALDNEIKLGANAAALLAMAKHEKITHSGKYVSWMHSLALGIETFQDPEKGSFVHVLHPSTFAVKETFRIIYYDGEAAFALMRLYELDKNPRWLNMVEKAFSFFIDQGYWKHKDHWLSYCSYELYRHVPKKEYLTFNLKNAKGILDFSLNRETTFPTLLELLMATFQILEIAKERGDYPDTSFPFDEEKLNQAIEHRVHHQLNGFFWPETAMYFKAPHHILGSFYIRHHGFRVRIDDVEHNLSGYGQYFQHYSSTMIEKEM